MLDFYEQLDNDILYLFARVYSAKYHWVCTKVRYVPIQESLDEETIFMCEMTDHLIRTRHYQSYVYKDNLPTHFSNADTMEITYVERHQCYPQDLMDLCQSSYDHLKYYCVTDDVTDVIWGSYVSYVDHILEYVKNSQHVNYEEYVHLDYDKSLFQFTPYPHDRYPRWLHTWVSVSSDLVPGSLTYRTFLREHIHDLYMATQLEFAQALEEYAQNDLFDDQVVPTQEQDEWFQEQYEANYENEVWYYTEYNSEHEPESDEE